MFPHVKQKKVKKKITHTHSTSSTVAELVNRPKLAVGIGLHSDGAFNPVACFFRFALLKKMPQRKKTDARQRSQCRCAFYYAIFSPFSFSSLSSFCHSVFTARFLTTKRHRAVLFHICRSSHSVEHRVGFTFF